MYNSINYKNISILINYKKDNSYNDKNWSWIKKRYEHLMPDAQICINSYTEDNYNKSKAINNASKSATGDILIIADANIAFNINSIQQGIEMLKEYPWVIPFDNVNCLNKQESEHLIRHDFKLDLNKILFALCKREINPLDYIFIVPRNHFESIGGFDEKITEWGEETIDFINRLNDRVGNYGRVENRNIWSMFYEKIEYPTYMPGININRIYNDIYMMKRSIKI